MSKSIAITIAAATLIALAWISPDRPTCGLGTVASLTTACEVLR